jgi:hypothetical protein
VNIVSNTTKKVQHIFSLIVKMIPAIAFHSVADVVDAFETLAEDISDDYQGLLDYFEDTYIGRPGRCQRRDPRFSHDMWNVNAGIILTIRLKSAWYLCWSPAS